MSDSAPPSPASPSPAPAPGGGPEPTRTTRAMPRWQAPEARELTDSFPGLRVAELAGVGGMGAVYRAEQNRLGRSVAVKILPAVSITDPEALGRFEREARILSGLNHPHILQIHDFGALSDGTLYLVTEWAGGGDFAKRLDGKAHPVAQVQIWVRQIAAALEAAHARGVIHRDLKPANVLVLEDGRLVLADFGLAHAGGGGFTTAITTTGAIFGTFEYMAPEQMESAGRVTTQADIYSLGVMTYQMLTGRVPRGAYARPSRIAKVPSQVDDFLNAAMSNDPARRPKNATAFAQEFERACRAPARRRQRQLIGLGVALVGLAVAWSRVELIRVEREAEEAKDRANHFAAEARDLRAAAQAERAAAEAARTAEPAPVAPAPAPTTPAGASPSALPADATLFTPAPAIRTFPEDNAASLRLRQSGGQGERAGDGSGGVAGLRRNPPAVSAPGSEPERVELPAIPWTWLLPEVDVQKHAVAGAWRLVRGELVSTAEGKAVLSLPVRIAVNYDIAVEFTRNSGQNSVAVFLPTLAGVGTFEVDAWDMGIAGLQMIDGQDMRRSNRYFPVKVVNGEINRLILEVRGDKVTAIWNGEPRMTWDLSSARFRIVPLWQAKPDVGVGVGSWMSGVTFHRIAYRAWPAPAKTP